MIQMTSYLTFNGNCREAMTFYQRCFGGELTLQTVAETPMAAQCPSGMQHHIMHATLASDDFILMATDMTSPAGYIAGNDMAVSLNFDTEEATHACYERLAQGGKIIDSSKQSSWGALFGVVQDKYGKVWMLNCNIQQYK